MLVLGSSTVGWQGGQWQASGCVLCGAVGSSIPMWWFVLRFVREGSGFLISMVFVQWVIAICHGLRVGCGFDFWFGDEEISKGFFYMNLFSYFLSMMILLWVLLLVELLMDGLQAMVKQQELMRPLVVSGSWDSALAPVVAVVGNG